MQEFKLGGIRDDPAGGSSARREPTCRLDAVIQKSIGYRGHDSNQKVATPHRRSPKPRDEMAIPDFQTFMLPLLKMTADGEEHSLTEVIERLLQELKVTDEDRRQLLQSGQTRLYNRIAWTTTYLRKAGLLKSVAKGRFRLTDRGREVLASKPAAIDAAFLESRFEEMQQFRGAKARRGEE